LLYKASGGVPRLINVMAHKAMLAAYGQAANRVNRSHMVRAITDTAESRSLGRWLARRDYWLWPMLAASAAAVIVLAPGLLGSG
jgi:MSHA biogenesis protein MshM